MSPTIWMCPDHQGLDPSCPKCQEWLAARIAEQAGKDGPDKKASPGIDLRFKKIEDYTKADLEFAINDAIDHCKNPNRIQTNAREHRSSLDFWRILRGVDAYNEQRRRKIAELSKTFVHPSDKSKVRP